MCLCIVDGGVVGHGVMSHEERNKLIGQLPTPPADGTPLVRMHAATMCAYHYYYYSTLSIVRVALRSKPTLDRCTHAHTCKSQW
jgi:hypothetical protein